MKIKTILTSLLCATLCISSFTPYCQTIAQAGTVSQEAIAPCNIAIVITSCDLSKESSTSLSCYAKTHVQAGYYAGVVVELQQYNGGWNTIKTWSSTDTGSAFVDTSYTVSKNYSYRLKITHEAYNVNWSLIESIVKYSDTVYCS